MKWFKKSKKKKLDQDTSKDQDWNKDLKRNNYSPNSAEQIGLHLKEKPHYNNDLEDFSPKNVLSCDFKKLSLDQHHILKKCKLESDADELMKILKRTNKSRFKNDILNPLIKCDFFERTILDKPKSPNQKYRLTSKFVRAKLV